MSFLRVIWLLAHPHLTSASLTFSVYLCVAGRAKWLEMGWWRSQIIQRREPSIKHSILSVFIFRSVSGLHNVFYLRGYGRGKYSIFISVCSIKLRNVYVVLIIAIICAGTGSISHVLRLQLSAHREVQNNHVFKDLYNLVSKSRSIRTTYYCQN